MNNTPVLIVAGPTASGKSARALAHARAKKGVIINADALQLYADLPILTALPSDRDRATVPHFLYGALHPNDQISSITWAERAVRAIHAAYADGFAPIVVGGTGLYLKALTEGLSNLPPSDEDVRADLTRRCAEIGTPALHAELVARDPVMGARLHPNDTQRILRALEVLESTGESLATFQAYPPTPPDPTLVFEWDLVNPDRDALYQACDARFDLMIQQGALEEVKSLLDVDDAAPITRTLGFKELRAYLKDELSLDAAIAKAKQATRNYAKRQVTWFKHQVNLAQLSIPFEDQRYP